MQRRHLFAAAGALALGLTSTLVAAQPRPDDRGPGNRPGQPHGAGPGKPHGQSNGRGPAHPAAQPPARGPGPGDHRMVHGRDRGPGAGADRRYYRGDRLPPDQRRRQYVVNDWRRHRLSAPPRGHQWVQSGADYLLVAMATGLIAQIALSR